MDDPLVTELPCVECGVPVFQLTARRKMYCSQRCAKRAWNRDHPKPRGVQASRNRTGYSFTITFTDAAGNKITRVGRGTHKAAAYEDATSQLPRGFVPVSEYRSTYATILRSLRKVK